MSETKLACKQEKVEYANISDIQIKRYKLQYGDILFSHINSLDHIGKTAIYKGSPELLIHGMNLLLLRPIKSIINPDFLHFYLRSNRVRAIWKLRAKRAVNQASLNQKNLSQLDIPIPNMKIQDKIVNILLKAEKIVKTRKKVNLLANKILQAVFFQMFGDSATITKKWKMIDFGDVISILTDYHANGSYEILRKNVKLFTKKIMPSWSEQQIWKKTILLPMFVI